MSKTATLERQANNVDQPECSPSACTYTPAVDILETDDELLLLVDVPGASPEAIDIEYDRGRLTIAVGVAERQGPQTQYTHREYGVGEFRRTFQVGKEIDASRMEAEVRDGVLTLHLPKAEAAKARKVAVKVV